MKDKKIYASSPHFLLPVPPFATQMNWHSLEICKKRRIFFVCKWMSKTRLHRLPVFLVRWAQYVPLLVVLSVAKNMRKIVTSPACPCFTYLLSPLPSPTQLPLPLAALPRSFPTLCSPAFISSVFFSAQEIIMTWYYKRCQLVNKLKYAWNFPL